MLLRTLLCCSLLLSLAVAASADTRHTATCRLRVQGYGPSKYGVKAAELSCQTSNGELLQVHTEPSIINDTNSRFEGVVIPKGRPTCKGFWPDSQYPPYGMLSFCDSRYNLQFVDPQVQNVYWEGRYANIAVANPAGIFWHVLFIGSNSTATLTGGVFIGNRVNIGGVVRAAGGQTIISDCLFSNNTGNYGAAFLGGGIPAIRIARSSFSHNRVVSSSDLADSEFVDNWGVVAILNSRVNFSACSFSSNSLEQGASTLSASDSDVILQHTRFSNNTGNLNAACYFWNTTANISNSVYEHNSALGPDGGQGGAMLIQRSRVRMSDCEFIGNIANIGGAFEADGDSDVYATRTMFSNNTSVGDGKASGPTSGGGAFFVLGNLTVDNCVARMNTGGAGGFVFAASYANVSICNDSTLVANHAGYAGGAVFLSDQASLRMADSRVFNNTAEDAGGAVFATDQSMATLQRVILANNSAAAQGIGGALYAETSAHLALSETLVTNNTAELGGGVVAIGREVVLQINNSSIEHNLARAMGGGVYVFEGAIHILGDSHIRYNKAGFSAGGILLYTTYFDPQQVQSAVQGNTAGPADDVGVLPTKMAISPASPNQPGLVQSVLADGAILYVFNVTGVHNMPGGGLSVVAEVKDASNPKSYDRFVNITEGNGLAYLYFRLPPSKYVVSTYMNSYPEAVLLNFTVDLPSCSLGQISGANGVCQTCPQGSYTFVTGGSLCWPCPANTECSHGDVITPKPSFWRSSLLSDQVHRCPNPIACKPKNGSSLEVCTIQTLQYIRNPAAARENITTTSCNGTRFSDLHCSSGYRGNLCGVCEAGFGSTSAFTCGKCMRFGLMVGLYVLAGCVLLGFIKLLCHCTLAETMAARLPSNALLPGGKQAVQITHLLKPFVIYLQYLLILAMLKIEWPDTVSYPIKGLAWVFSTASPEMLSVDCLVSSAGLPMGIKKTLFYLIAPLVMLLALLLIEGFAYMLHFVAAKTSDAGVWDRLASNSIVVMFFFLPSLARTSLSLFACIPIDQSGTSTTDIGLAAVGRYWLLDLDQQCYSGYHLHWSYGLGIPLLILVCCTLPGAIFYLAWRNRKHLNDGGFARHYGFLFRTYKPACCYWEGVIALQTIGFVAISVFGHSLGSYYQIVLVIFVLIMVAVTVIAFKPYEHTISQQAMEYGLLCLLLTALSTLTLLPDGFVQAGDTNKQYRSAMGVLLVLLNGAYVAWVAVQLFRLVQWSRVIDTLKSFVSSMLGVAHQPWRTPSCMRLLNSAKDTCLRG